MSLCEADAMRIVRNKEGLQQCRRVNYWIFSDKVPLPDRMMEYQCTVVYSIVKMNAPPPHLEGSRSIMDWIKSKTRRVLPGQEDYLVSGRCSIARYYGYLASLYYADGYLNIAIETYRHALLYDPSYGEAYCNMATLIKQEDKTADCGKYYQKAAQLCPNLFDAMNNYANHKYERGKFDQAIKLYYKIIVKEPSFYVAHNNLATVLQNQGKYTEALKYYKSAIEANPQFADAHSNMGYVLIQMDDKQGALNSFRRAIEINPRMEIAHFNLASIYKYLNHISEAIESYKIALKLNPNFSDAFCNLAHCLQMVCDWDDYEKRMHNIKTIINNQLSLSKTICSVHPHHTFLYPLSGDVGKEIAARQAQRFSENVSKWKKFKYPKRLDGRLRIGYVSSDFGNHPTSHLMQSIPGLHDIKNVEVFCYALSEHDGSRFREKIEKRSEHFTDLSNKSRYEAARIINSDKINILVNMNGYTKGAKNEIFAAKPAPIQVMWLGYPGTSGADYMDYIITDKTSTPPTSANDFSEKFAFMPHTYMIGDHKQMFYNLKHRYTVRLTDNEATGENFAVVNIPRNLRTEDILSLDLRYERGKIHYENYESFYYVGREIYLTKSQVDAIVKNEEKKIHVNRVFIENGKCIKIRYPRETSGEELYESVVLTARSQYNLPDHGIVFCNFNQLYKIDPYLMAVWVNILKRVPNSYLWLLSFPKAGTTNLKKFVRGLGLNPNRLIFSDIETKEEHVRRIQLADICLDSVLCNGHTTTMDVLWAATPVVTMPGATLASRVSSSIMKTIYCPELIAKDLNDYEDIAVMLGSNDSYRKYIRAKVTVNRASSTLFNCRTYARELEKLYAIMWSRYEKGLEPDHIQSLS